MYKYAESSRFIETPFYLKRGHLSRKQFLIARLTFANCQRPSCSSSLVENIRSLREFFKRSIMDAVTEIQLNISLETRSLFFQTILRVTWIFFSYLRHGLKFNWFLFYEFHIRHTGYDARSFMTGIKIARSFTRELVNASDVILMISIRGVILFFFFHVVVHCNSLPSGGKLLTRCPSTFVRSMKLYPTMLRYFSRVKHCRNSFFRKLLDFCHLSRMNSELPSEQIQISRQKRGTVDNPVPVVGNMFSPSWRTWSIP